METVCRSGEAYAWTRKQGGVGVRGTVTLAGRPPARGRTRARSSTTPPPTTSATHGGAGAPGSAPTPRAARWPGTSWRASTTRPRQRTHRLGRRGGARGRPRRHSPLISTPRRRPALRRRGRPASTAEPAAGAQPLPPAVRHLLRHAPRRPRACRRLRRDGGPRRLLVIAAALAAQLGQQQLGVHGPDQLAQRLARPRR